MKFVTLIARILIGGLFIYASIHKIAEPTDFAASIRNYGILPVSWSNIVALTLPWIELGAGGFLILGIETKPSALITTAMLGIFLAALFYVYHTGIDIDCGCFNSSTSSSGHIGVYHLLRDSLLFLISLIVL
ncbi:MAG: MauE/DoxX family redox-associated membrane protein, partial [Desulfomonilaceae bacterium]